MNKNDDFVNVSNLQLPKEADKIAAVNPGYSNRKTSEFPGWMNRSSYDWMDENMHSQTYWW
jgi:hypothetical protein